MLLTWCVLAGLILLLAPRNLTNRFQFAFARIFYWPLAFGRNLSHSARIRKPLGEVVPRSEYIRLQNHLANLEARLAQAQKKIDRLSGLRNRLPLEGAGLMVADIITASIDKRDCHLIINRGSEDGLAAGQFVLADNSVIGTISDVSNRTARVRLFTDPSANIAVQIAGAERYMRGAGGRFAVIPMVRQKAKTGMEVLACKKPGFLPAPMIIAKVVESQRDESALLWNIVVEPVCDIEKLTDVAVIVMNPQ